MIYNIFKERLKLEKEKLRLQELELQHQEKELNKSKSNTSPFSINKTGKTNDDDLSLSISTKSVNETVRKEDLSALVFLRN